MSNSIYDKAIKSVETAKATLAVAQRNLRGIADGYFYATVEQVYGSSWKSEHNNLYCAEEVVAQYNGDNGYAYIFTNNPEVLEKVPDNNINDDWNIYPANSMEDVKIKLNEWIGIRLDKLSE